MQSMSYINHVHKDSHSFILFNDFSVASRGKTGFSGFRASGPKLIIPQAEAKFREGIILGKLHRYDEAPEPMAAAKT